MLRLRRYIPAIGLVAGCSCIAMVLSLPVIAADQPKILKDIQGLYEKQEYQHALEELSKLESSRAMMPEAQRLKVRLLVKTGKPKEALEEYDKLEMSQRREEQPLLNEIALSLILVLTKDMRDQMRGAAYTALKEINSDKMVPYFEDGLSDGSGPVRVLAVEGLGRLEAGLRSKRLRTAVDDQAGLVKARVVKVLGKSGDQSVIPLIEAATKDELATVRIAAYGALMRLGRPNAWEPLRNAMGAPNPEDQAEAIRTIADLRDQRGTSMMAELLTYKQPSVRAAAARGLGHLRRSEHRKAIEHLLKDPIPAVRESAAAALADLGDKESVAAISGSLSDKAFSVRAAAVAALLQLGQPYGSVAHSVRDLAQANDPAARSSAAFALGKANGENAGGAVGVLANLASDPLPGPKIVALRSMGHVGNRDILPLLKDALHDSNEAVSATAAGAFLHHTMTGSK
ncbi:conserved exported protein of unknown function [Nitrospira sp. KM1]|uniref:HEAT repeat domain-containing protein n=1 Tax=Nitrospira sp. KM1 TaxID=1936990 RepID=UPI0013A78929|nr:HEAT repeat domain-containing protein [Nitrospira sp. KM1]BCA54372.1 conserved exported protein of unknown function [Nitrospira sp. KM1]